MGFLSEETSAIAMQAIPEEPESETSVHPSSTEAKREDRESSAVERVTSGEYGTRCVFVDDSLFQYAVSHG